MYENKIKKDVNIPDGHVHVMPNYGKEHIESETCWCCPELIEDFTRDGGKRAYLHREIQ